MEMVGSWVGGNMTLGKVSQHGFVVGDISIDKNADLKKIAEEFRSVLKNQPATMKNLATNTDDVLFHVQDDGSIITLAKGGWSIMDKLSDEILQYIPGPIVEIGAGESTEVFANLAIKYDRELYTCDLEMGGMFNVFDGPFFDRHTCFIGKSEDFIKEFKGNPAIVFIDGQHTYETVKMETDFFLPLLKPWGVMFFHDMFPHHERLIDDPNGVKCSTAYKMRQELERNPDIDVFTWPYTALNVGLTMVMKHFPNDERRYWQKNGRVSE